MQDDSHPSKGLRMLQRIAEVLDRPVSDFYQRAEPLTETATPSASECELMLAAFLRIKDADARARIVALMRTCAGH